MRARHSLLKRQIKRHLHDPERVSPELASFIDAVDSAYHEFDLDRSMLERSMELSSRELLEANAGLRAIHGDLEQRVLDRTQELSRANEELVSEIAERQRSEAQLAFIASHDALTGLYNRRFFEQVLEDHLQLARKGQTEGAVCFLDLDQFKDVNDTMGHGIGDELLRNVVELLRRCLREGDVLARQGGDEFAILLPDSNALRGRQVAALIEDAIRRHVFWLDNHPLSVTVSIGVALYPRHGLTVEELLSNADLAMYQAKSRGRSRVEVFRSNRDWRRHGELRLHWRNQIVDALEHDRFVLYGQPMRPLKAQCLPTYEALLRLKTPTGEVIRPGDFMDVVEEFGLAPAVDRWVVRHAIDVLASQQEHGRPVRISVNLSGKSMGDAELLGLIRSQIASTSIDPSLLIAEVTETAAITNISQAQRFIRTIKELGCQFALDDFGAGFSSFFHLKHLPVDFLKIDGAFIKDLRHSPTDRHLVQAMVSLARGLGKQTIAEFVADRETLNLVREYGVDYAQGYHVGRPRELWRLLEAESLLPRAA